MNDWLKEWYNDQFEKIDLSPSSEVWEHIARTMEEWPKHWYVANTNDLNTRPRQSTWENLNNQLVKERQIRLANRFSYAVASVVAFLFLIIPVQIEDSYLLTDLNYELAASSARENIPKEIVSLASRTRSSGEMFQRRIASTNNTTSELSITPVTAELEQREFATRNVLSNQLNNVDDLSGVIAISPVVASLEPKQLSLTSNLIDRKLNNENIAWSKHQFSLNVLPQLTILNNALAQHAFVDDNTEIIQSPSVALQFAYQRNFNSRNGLKVAALVNNKKSLVTSSDLNERSIDLNYLSLAAIYTSKWSLNKISPRLSFQAETGLIGGVVQSRSVTFNDERIPYLETGFGQFDLGAYLGASLVSSINDQWSWSVGLASQIGLINIFNGNQYVPRDYFSTSTQSAGLSFGLIYNL